MSESPKFVADAMLGSFARKLRVFGFDTVYFRDGADSSLLELARMEGRVVLTSDRVLAATAKKHGVVALMVEGRGDRQRLASLEAAARKVDLLLANGASRCTVCNAPLRPVKRADVGPEVPTGVVMRHRAYLRCPDCGKTYWKGSHWKKLRRLSSVLSSTITI